MAYLGSTQLSSLANPPRLLVPRIGGLPGSTQLSTSVGTPPYREQAGGVWLYASSHGSTEVMDTNFFTDAKELGIRSGDILLGFQWTTLGSSVVFYAGVFRAVSSAGAALTTGGTITSTFA